MNQDAITKCLRLDGRGGASVQKSGAAPAPGGGLWARFAHDDRGLEDVLVRDFGVDRQTACDLLDKETRPHCVRQGDGALLVLRGVNLNPDSDPEDMISLRVWIDADKLVSVQLRRLIAVDAVEAQLDAGKGPETLGDLIVAIAEGLTDRMQPVVDALAARMESLEDEPRSREADADREAAADLRRTVVTLRRFIAPQRDALESFIVEPFSWQAKLQERRLQTIVNRITRIIEHLDEIHSRATIHQDGLAAMAAQRLNRTMFLLAIVSGVFLPLTFITGLLGMNVGGLPGLEDPNAFWIVTALLAAVGLVEILLFARLRFFDPLRSKRGP